jgi:hypothetical protein
MLGIGERSTAVGADTRPRLLPYMGWASVGDREE